MSQPLKELNERIMKDGCCLEGGILKVDSFINQQIDTRLLKLMAEEFVRRFSSLNINKILTVEASGIAPAIVVGCMMNLPVVFAKKKKPSTMGDMYHTQVLSFTKQQTYSMVVGKDFLTPSDHVLFIDDFLAFSNAAKGIIDLCQQAGATIEGMGLVVEKEFCHGREELYRMGIPHIESLAIIESLDNCQIKQKD